MGEHLRISNVGAATATATPRGMGCGPTKEEGLKDANSQDPNEAIDKTVEIVEDSLDTQHPILRRQRTWESIYDRKDEGKTPKSQKKSKVTYRYARTTFMIKPAVKKGGIPTWEVARESHQILGNQEAKVTELYSGILEGMEQREDRKIYHMRTTSIHCELRDPITEEDRHEFDVEYDEVHGKYPVKRRQYVIPGNGYLQVNCAEDLSWHLNDDNEEIWTETRGGDTYVFLTMFVDLDAHDKQHELEAVTGLTFVKAATNKKRGADSDDEDADSDDEKNGLEVTFVPDDTIHWSRMEQVSNRTVKAQVEDSD